MKKTYSEAVEAIKRQNRGTGRDLEWHLLNGSSVYKQLFLVLIGLVDKNEDTGFWITKTELLKRAKVPHAMVSYPLYKLEAEELITTKNGKIYVEAYQIENWRLLCSIIQRSTQTHSKK